MTCLLHPDHYKRSNIFSFHGVFVNLTGLEIVMEPFVERKGLRFTICA